MAIISLYFTRKALNFYVTLVGVTLICLQEARTQEETIKTTSDKPLFPPAQESDSTHSWWFNMRPDLNITVVPDIRSLQLSKSTQTVTDEPGITIEFDIGDHRLILDLHATRDLLSATYEEPLHATKQGLMQGIGCEWQGVIRGIEEESMVALSICPVIRGVISGGETELLVEPSAGSATPKDPHLVYANTLVEETGNHCGVKSQRSNTDNNQTVDITHHSIGPDTTIRKRRHIPFGPHGAIWADKKTRFVEVVLIVDNTFYKKYKDEVYSRSRGLFNIVNAVFREIRIVVVLTDIIVWSNADEITVSSDHVATLDNLRPYRLKLIKDNPDSPNDNTILLTSVDFNGSTVGYASLRGMCSNDDSVAVVQDKGVMGTVAQTLAHEMGHNLGMSHDDELSGCRCKTSKCLMAAKDSDIYKSNTGWSSCSKSVLANEIDSFHLECLRNVPKNLYNRDGKTCGNGVVEDGEQCDCGPSDLCTNPCCIAEECKLAVNATCASGACCDTKKCRPFDMGHSCRPAAGDCDLPEYCSGHSENCPRDVYKWNGVTCNKGEGHCYEGYCGSPNNRCSNVWGPGTLASDSGCSKRNEEGRETGNCGWADGSYNTFKKCSNKDSPCGTLHCRPLQGSKPVLQGSFRYGWWGNSRSPCHYIISSEEIPQNFWLVPNGSPCAKNKMCINQKCNLIVEPDGIKECPKNCSNHGICNSRGNCHCEEGYAPPDCSTEGMGGSFDSHSVQVVRRKDPLLEGLLLFFAIIIPIIIIICCCWEKIRLCWERDGNSRMEKCCPCCADCINTCCCPAMAKLMHCLILKGPFGKKKKDRGNKQAIEEAVDAEEAATICHVSLDMKEESHTESWGVADERLFTEIVKITPKNSPDLSRKIMLPSNSPIRHHKSVDGLDRRQTYQQSISVDSGCVSDADEGDTRPQLHSQMSMTSLVGLFSRFSLKSNKSGSTKEINRRSKVFGSQKSIPLSRFVVDPLVGNRNSRHGTPPPDSIRPAYNRSVSTGASLSTRVHLHERPPLPSSAAKPHKSDENLHKLSSKLPKRGPSPFSKARNSDEDLQISVHKQENICNSEKKPMMPPQMHWKAANATSSPARAAPPPPPNIEQEDKSKEVMKPSLKSPKAGGQQSWARPSTTVANTTTKKAIMPPKHGPIIPTATQKGTGSAKLSTPNETANSTSKGRQNLTPKISPQTDKPIAPSGGNSVKALAKKLEQNK